MEKEFVDLVRQSYGRCLNNERFFDKFYDRFLACDPEVRNKFSNTDFDRQKRLINTGVNMMIMFARGDHMVANNAINRIRSTHGSDNLDIHPRLYALWKKCLLDTVAECDSKLNKEIASAWSKILDVGIKHISEGYH